MIKACIFDLDGVVVYTDNYHYRAWRKIANHMGYELTPFENMMLKGLSRMDSLDVLLEMKGVHVEPEEKIVLLELKNKWYRKFLKDIDSSMIARGAVELIHGIKSSGMKTALASSSKNARIVVKKLKLDDLFDVIVDGNMISASKPDPEIFIKCAKMLRVDPKECMVFEDAQPGIDAANSAGMHTVGISEDFQLSGCDICVEHISDVSLDDIVEFGKSNININCNPVCL